MSRNPLQLRLITIVEPVAVSAGYELVDLRFVLEQGGWVLRVMVDHLPDRPASERVGIIDCEKLSRELSAVLDVEDPIPQAYSLEVSTPGIERPLRTAKHFEQFIGQEARVQLAVPLQLPNGDSGSGGTRRNFRGTLRGVSNERVVIECDGQKFELPLADIDHAKLVPNWDEVMRKHN